MGDDKRLFVYRNQAGSEGKVVNTKSGYNMTKLKKLASKKLGIRIKRLFLPSGAEIQDMDELQNNDTLYVSEGEPFYKTTNISSGQETFHVSVLGSGGVGKSALTLRFVRDCFVKDWDPTIEDAYRKSLDVEGKLCILEILDTAGQDDFESLRAQWMMDKSGYIFVFSLDSRVSLHELQPFFDLHIQINENKHPMPPIVVVGNKRDLVDKEPQKREVTSEEGSRIAQSYNAQYVETSALLGKNVNQLFQKLVTEVRKRNAVLPPKKGCQIL